MALRENGFGQHQFSNCWGCLFHARKLWRPSTLQMETLLKGASHCFLRSERTAPNRFAKMCQVFATMPNGLTLPCCPSNCSSALFDAIPLVHPGNTCQRSPCKQTFPEQLAGILSPQTALPPCPYVPCTDFCLPPGTLYCPDVFMCLADPLDFGLWGSEDRDHAQHSAWHLVCA